MRPPLEAALEQAGGPGLSPVAVWAGDAYNIRLFQGRTDRLKG
jgi:hypothetical protein